MVISSEDGLDFLENYFILKYFCKKYLVVFHYKFSFSETLVTFILVIMNQIVQNQNQFL